MIITILILLILIWVFLFYASYSIQSGIYIHAFCRKQTDEHIVALTFDDGPDISYTPKVLDVLKAYHVPATFFCIGSKIKGNEYLIQRMIEEGHTVGNHSYIHTWRFPFYSFKQMEADVKQCQELLEQTSNQQINWFRPPYGVTNPTIAKVVKQLRYKTIGWNIRTLDTQSLSHEKVINRIRKRLRPGSVILLHDRMPQSDILLKCILDELKAKQYRIVSLKTMI